MYELIDVIRMVSSLLTLLVVVRVILSWMSLERGNAVVDLIYRLTEPMMGPARRLIPSAGGIDFSPMIVLAGIWIGERVLIRVLLSMA